jgi:hypothetical protein
VVLAQTLVEMDGPVNDWHFWRGLGTRSLGTVLFSDPQVKRGKLYFARLPLQQPWVQRLLPPAMKAEMNRLGSGRVWYARCARFSRKPDRTPLWVMEAPTRELHLGQLMNLYYEEAGAFKVGRVLQEQGNAYQVETLHGKRTKVKSNSVMLKFDALECAEFHTQVEALAKEVDTEFLWECSPEGEFDFTAMAQEYFGEKPTVVQQAATLAALHAAPIQGQGHVPCSPARNFAGCFGRFGEKAPGG